MDSDQFIRLIFSGCQDVAREAITIADAEEGFTGRVYVPGSVVNSSRYVCISTVRPPLARQRVVLRQILDLVFVYVFVLDDVGTKVSRETVDALAIKPTIILETSPGNFQYFYVLRYGADPMQVAAAAEDAARQGLTDGGATKPAQLMRVPGSLNRKFDPPFVARVVESFPERLYTFSEVCVGLGISPAGGRGWSSGGPQGLAEGQSDLTYDWLLANGFVLGGPNPRGWVPVACPWEGSHTPGKGFDHGTDYLPGKPGVFSCLHEHCKGKGLDALQDWIRSQDAAVDLSTWPASETEAIGRAIAATLEGQNGGGGIFTPPRQEGAREAVLGDLVHVASENAYWSISAAALLTHKAVDDRYYRLLRPAGLLDGTTPSGGATVIDPHRWLRRQPDTRMTSRLTHRLGQALIVDDCLNMAPPLPPGLLDDRVPDEWIRLAGHVCGAMAEIVMDWLAMVVGCTDKPGWHLLLRGRQGIGKNLLLKAVILWLKAAKLQEDVSAVKIGGQWNTFLTMRLVVVNELKMNTRGATTGHDIYNTIKAWTSRDALTITIYQRYLNPYEAANCSCWALLSNEGVPLPIDHDDRRFLVWDTPSIEWTGGTDAYRRLDEAIVFGNGIRIIVAWLQKRWREMTPDRRQALIGKPPMTAGKLDLIEIGAEGINGAIRLAIAGQHGETWPDLMRIEDVLAKTQQASFTLLPEAMKRQLTSQRVIEGLKAAGAVRLGVATSAGQKTQFRVWCLRPQVAGLYEQLGKGQKLVDKYHELQRAGAVAFTLGFKPKVD